VGSAATRPETMLVGAVRELKQGERRVALTPSAARELVSRGHEVIVEAGAGEGVGFEDSNYEAAGATIARSAEQVWAEAGLLLKVKEPIPPEYERLRAGLTLFTYLHLAAAPELTEALVASQVDAIAYETVTDDHGRLPLLEPMSTIAGRLAAQVGAHLLLAPNGGPGRLAAGAPGIEPGRFVVIGGGTAGTAAALMAAALGADVVVLERSQRRIRELEERSGNALRVLSSDEETIQDQLERADVVIGAVLIPGARAPRLVSRGMLPVMKPGAVLVDVAIDQGGCFETSRPTTHDDPVYQVDGVRHYCVANMPGAVPITATSALVNATLPYALALAGGREEAMSRDPGLAAGLNVSGGRVLRPEVAAAG
jgi:alanine dehydrogenase